MSAQSDGHIEHKLEHYTQRYNWDCGVSCVIMLLKGTRKYEMINNFEQICLEEGFNRSTWTIDLCYLLKRFNIKHAMFTITFGVNETYKKHSYYDMIIDIDRDRVTRKFLEATSSEIKVYKRSVSHDELLHHVRFEGPAIVLVDAGLLVCDLCKHNKLKVEFRRCFGGSYSGHYIVVVGHSRGRLLYRDPALADRVCVTSAVKLHRARTAPGTDHDVILIYNDYTIR